MTGLDLLTELRRNGLRQKDLAMRLGVSEAAVSKYVNGRTPITPERWDTFVRAIRDERLEVQETQEQAIA
ncbi:MAG: helix-turn-helix domain-containing protein [Chloroflexota bacterium]|nr:helix-turn-helix domain-containing protein [Chloroflexota bacterium]